MPGAIFHLRAAGRRVAPLSPWPDRAVAALLYKGAEAERREDWLTALEAYDAVRAAAVGAGSFHAPHADALAAPTERVPAVMARAREAQPVGARTPPEQRPALDARFREDLAKDRSPGPLPATLAVLCLAGWVAAMAAGSWRSLADSGPLRRGTALRWGLASALPLAGWIAFLAVA